MHNAAEIRPNGLIWRIGRVASMTKSQTMATLAEKTGLVLKFRIAKQAKDATMAKPKAK